MESTLPKIPKILIEVISHMKQRYQMISFLYKIR